MTVVRYRKIRPAPIANQIAAFAGYRPLTLKKKKYMKIVGFTCEKDPKDTLRLYSKG